MTTIYPCVGCGYCCTKVPCSAAFKKWLIKIKAPCPELRQHGGRYWCGMIEDAEGQQKRDLMKELSIGAGCSSPLFNSQRDALLKKG